MADVKESHYWEQLRTALTAGQWDSSTPAKAPKGTFLSWPELFRKFRKHSKRKDIPEAATQLHFLSLLLVTTKQASKENDEQEEVVPNQFEIGDECILYEERRGDVQMAYETLLRLKSSDDFVRLSTAYLAYALDRPSECLEHVSSATFFDTIISKQTNGDTGPAVLVTSPEEKEKPGYSPRMTHSPIKVENEDMWMLLEAVCTSCLEGMSHERISSGSPSKALNAYDRGIRLLYTFEIPKTPPTRPGRPNFESFLKYRELWRWVERLLWRSAILSSRHRSPEEAMIVFRAYAVHSTHWPASFQAKRRATTCALYLRALIILASSIPRDIGQKGPQRVLFPNKMTWNHEVRSLVLEYRSILSVSTRFPSAGERNVLVEEFVDYCIAAWEAGGSIGDQAGWVLDILWWATRLTFNSPRVLRHMTRLLHVSGDNQLATRVLKLYVQVVRKARETGSLNAQGEDTSHGAVDVETDIVWVEALVQGARMLCRISGGVEEARDAETLIKLARVCSGDNLPVKLAASVDIADGVCKTILANREQDPATRNAHLSEAVTLFIRAVDNSPTPSAYFHAALALSRHIPERNLEKAIEYCRLAVETASNDVRHWHLLALLEAKLGEWNKSRALLETAIGIAENVEERVREEEMHEEGLISRDYGRQEGHQEILHASINPSNGSTAMTNGHAKVTDTSSWSTLIDPDARCLPLAADLLQPSPDHPKPSHRDLFEHALQLHMTHLTLTELIEGPESAEACWPEVFEWYSQRRDTTAQSRSARPSVDTRMTPSPASVELEPQESNRPSNAISETSSSATPLQNSGTDSTLSTINNDTMTLRSPAQGSLETSAMDTVEVSALSPSLLSPLNGQIRNKVRPDLQSMDREKDKKGKRVQQMLKNQVYKQSARFNTISKKIGHGVARGSMTLQRSNSAPDFHAVLTHAGPYQASSIHSRRRISFSSRSQRTARDRGRTSLAPSPPPPPLPLSTNESGKNNSSGRERRLLSELWLMSAATFRRLEKLDQARGAIQEAEKLDERNEAVWVQLGLYFSTRGEESMAIESFQKALFISQDDRSAIIHLCQLYLTSSSSFLRSTTYGAVDLAAGMLEELTRGAGWDIPEAWYLLAKAYKMQSRMDRERECLLFALGLAEVRGVRDVGAAIGWCL